MQAKMNYWKIKPGDKEVYNYFENAYNIMSEDELNSPAYNSSEDAIIDIGAKPEGLQIMRFNPEYWDRSLPISAIQLMSFWTSGYTEEQKVEDIQRLSYPQYPLIFVNQINWNEISRLIMQGK
jgi:hypothetical protein